MKCHLIDYLTVLFIVLPDHNVRSYTYQRNISVKERERKEECYNLATYKPLSRLQY